MSGSDAVSKCSSVNSSLTPTVTNANRLHATMRQLIDATLTDHTITRPTSHVHITHHKRNNTNPSTTAPATQGSKHQTHHTMHCPCPTHQPLSPHTSGQHSPPALVHTKHVQPPFNRGSYMHTNIRKEHHQAWTAAPLLSNHAAVQPTALSYACNTQANQHPPNSEINVLNCCL